MSDKKTPKDVQDIYCSTKADLEQKLIATEEFVIASNAKSFDVVVGVLNETKTLISGYVNDKSATLSKSVKQGRISTEAIARTIDSITALQNKIIGFDKSKELGNYKQKCSNDLELEVVYHILCAKFVP